MPSYTSADGLTLHYTDEGAGHPVIALSGLTRTGRDFDYIAPHLGDVRLVRPDYRGRGQSGWSPNFNTYSLPVESGDVLRLMDHLGLERAAILGTSRGGLIAMGLAAHARDRLTGVCLNDIGPEIAPEGLAAIEAFIGRNPAARTLDEVTEAMATRMAGFEGVPMDRWRAEAELHFRETPDGLSITYDPALRDAFLSASGQPAPDLWPLFDAMAGLPLALIRGANSDLLTPDTAAEMRRRRPDMIYAEVPGRGHIPFLDEPEAVAAIRAWVEHLK